MGQAGLTMKITSIETVVVNADIRNWIFVKVVTDQPGLWGWGEATLEWKTRAVTGCIDDLAPLADRVTAARDLLNHPKVRVTGFEAAHGFTYSWQTIAYLTQAMPDRNFVWIMGADNLVHFSRWERWRDIAAMVPMAVYVRPGSGRRAPVSMAASALAQWRIDEDDATRLATLEAPAWVYLHGRQSPLSSSAIRARRQHVKPK